MLHLDQSTLPARLRPWLTACGAAACWLVLGSAAQAQSASWFDRAPASRVRTASADELAPPSVPPAIGSDLPGIPGLTAPAAPTGQGELDERQYLDAVAPALPTNCCKGCPSFWYAMPEYLAVSRNESSSRQLSNALAVGDLNAYDPGFRFTLGRQRDCLDAIELVYAGVYGAGETTSAASAAGAIQSAFNPGAGAFNLDDFNNATFQSAVYEWNLTNIEVNQRQWGWDIVSSVWGPRYINLNETLTFTSLPNPPATFGRYQVTTRSNLFGYHFGGDMLYPVGPAWNIGGKVKLGGFVTTSEQETTVINNSVVVTQNSADDVNYSFVGEFGVYTTYRVRPWCTLRTGYEFWYLWNVAVAPDQIDFNPRPGMAGFVNDSSELYLGMFTAGAEIQW